MRHAAMAPSALSALSALLGALAGCDADCSLPARIEEIADNAPLRNCGDLPTTSSTAAGYEASRACVLAALAEKAPFELRWDVGADDSFAFIGIWSGGYQLRRIETDGTRSTTYTCSAVTDLGACGDLFTTLCLECTDASATTSCE